MSWDRIEGQWKQRRGKAVHHWSKVMNDELAGISGKYEELVRRLQEKYGIAREEAKRQVDEYKTTVDQLKKSSGKLMKMQKTLSKKMNGTGSRFGQNCRRRKELDPGKLGNSMRTEANMPAGTNPSGSDSDAEFLGWQEAVSGELVPLYIITVADHPSYHSTVSDETLRKLRLRVPQTPSPNPETGSSP